MSQPYTYIGAAVILGGLLGYLLWSAPPSRQRTAAAWIATTLMAWLGGEILVALSEDPWRAQLAIRWTYGAIALVPFVVHRFIAHLDEPRALRHRAASVATMALALLTAAALPTDLMIAGAVLGPSGFQRIEGPLFRVFAGGLIALLLTDVCLAVRVARGAADPRQRLRCQYFLAGLGAAAGLGIVDLAVLQPLGVRGHRMFIAPLEVTFGMAMVIHPMVHSRLVDLSTALRRTVIYAALFATLLVPCLGLSLLAEQLATGTIALGPSFVTAALFCVAGFGFPRLRVSAERTLEQAVFGARADDRALLQAASREVTSVLSLSTLAAVTRTTLARAFDGAEATIWLRQRDALLPLDRHGEDLTASDAVGLAAWADAASDPVVLSERPPAATPPPLNALRVRGVELVLALRVKARTVGLLTLGRRGDARVYTDDDIALVATLANQVAIALENARLYEELRESREQVSHASRLSAVGTLAAGVAHEIRNPLVAIRTFLQLFPHRKDDPEFVAHFHALSLKEVDRIARLITDLLTFSRSRERTVAHVDLADVTAHVATLLGPEAVKRGVSLMVSCAEALPPVDGDADQLEQAILNVALNAVEASPPGGTVTILVQPARTLSGTLQVRVEIIDQGAGVAREHRDAIFTPFFSTKEGGTGLGLAVAHQLVAEHAGRITVGSTPGGGATFILSFPVPREAGEAEAGPVVRGRAVNE
jgi:signal transduction histidine kinase